MLTDRRTDGRKVITIAHPEHSSSELKSLIMTQAFEIWYFCGGRVGCMDIFSGFVELSFPPLYIIIRGK